MRTSVARSGLVRMGTAMISGLDFASKVGADPGVSAGR
jgi:hypothetical protein